MDTDSFLIENGTLINCPSEIKGDVVIPNSVKEIGREAFLKHSGITSVTIPDSVQSIGINAFRDCNNLVSVFISKSVYRIERYAFQNCPNLNVVKIDSDNKVFDSRDGCNAIIETRTNTIITGCKSTIIPDSVEEISESAFWGSIGLNYIKIPASIKRIGVKAFRGCDGLEAIIVEPNNKVYDSRSGCNAIIETKTNKLVVGCKTTNIPVSITEIGDYAFFGCKGLKTLELHDHIKTIGGKAFRGCSILTKVYIPKSVVLIKEGAFSDCINMCNMKVDPLNEEYDSRDSCNAIVHTKQNSLISGCNTTIIPKTITEIGEWAFSGCAGVISIVLHDSIKKIGEKAFRGCNNLKSVSIGKSVSIIGWRAFSDCDNLSSIIVDKDNPTFDSRNSCNAIIETQTNCLIVGCKGSSIPNTITHIGNCAFWACHELSSIEIPQSVSIIGKWAFSACRKIRSVVIPDSVFEVGERAFRGCTNLKKIVIPDSVKTLGTEAYYRCNSATSLEIGHGVSYIDKTMFGLCYNVKTVKVPSLLANEAKNIFPGSTIFIS